MIRRAKAKKSVQWSKSKKRERKSKEIKRYETKQRERCGGRGTNE